MIGIVMHHLSRDTMFDVFCLAELESETRFWDLSGKKMKIDMVGIMGMK